MKNWLIKKLGGYTEEEMNYTLDEIFKKDVTVQVAKRLSDDYIQTIYAVINAGAKMRDAHFEDMYEDLKKVFEEAIEESLKEDSDVLEE